MENLYPSGRLDTIKHSMLVEDIYNPPSFILKLNKGRYTLQKLLKHES